MESLSLKGRRSSNASQGPGAGEEPEGNANDTSQLDKEEGNVLMTIIGQCAYPSCPPRSGAQWHAAVVVARAQAGAGRP